MILMEGLLDYRNAEHDYANLYFFTGNSYVKRNGALVMGRGAARQVRDLYPGIDKQFGQAVLESRDAGRAIYGVIVKCGPNENIGVFQVKHGFREKAKLDLITFSVQVLGEFASRFDRGIHMNYPGIGNGGLMQTDVAPLLATLPDNVFIYKT